MTATTKRRPATKPTRPAKKKAKAETIFRVVPLSPELRRRVRLCRAEHGTNQAVIAHAVESFLPATIDGLRKLGVIDAATGKSKKYRLPFGDDALAALAKASEQTGLPATLLLKVCLYCLD